MNEMNGRPPKGPEGGPPPQPPAGGPPPKPPAPPPEKPRRRRRRHPIRKLIILLIIAALIAVGLYFGRGLGLGQGGGSGGDSKGPDATASLPADTPAPESTPPAEDDEPQGGAQQAMTVTVEVTQGKYLIDGAEVSLADIEALLQKADPDASTFIVDDNYGSAKAHDELTALFEKYGISAVTQ